MKYTWNIKCYKYRINWKCIKATIIGTIWLHFLCGIRLVTPALKNWVSSQLFTQWRQVERADPRITTGSLLLHICGQIRKTSVYTSQYRVLNAQLCIEYHTGHSYHLQMQTEKHCFLSEIRTICQKTSPHQLAKRQDL